MPGGAYRESVLDLEPHGPLPSQIYWRRRGLALGIAALVVVIVAAVGFTVFRAGSDAENSGSADQAAAVAQAVSPDSANQQPGSPPPAAAPPGADRPGANSGSTSGSNLAESAPTSTLAKATPTKAVKPPPVLSAGDDCPDSTLAVKGITNQPEYVIGDQPIFTMVVTNIGVVSCKRDIGAAVLAAYVYSLDNERLWSNLDCAPSNETLVKTFDPGEQVTTEVTWTGMGSARQCPLPREPIGPGTYNLVVQLGNVRSASVPFILQAANESVNQESESANQEPAADQPDAE